MFCLTYHRLVVIFLGVLSESGLKRVILESWNIESTIFIINMPIIPYSCLSVVNIYSFSLSIDSKLNIFWFWTVGNLISSSWAFRNCDWILFSKLVWTKNLIEKIISRLIACSPPPESVCSVDFNKVSQNSQLAFWTLSIKTNMVPNYISTNQVCSLLLYLLLAPLCLGGSSDWPL